MQQRDQFDLFLDFLYRLLEASAEECPAYVLISQGFCLSLIMRIQNNINLSYEQEILCIFLN